MEGKYLLGSIGVITLGAIECFAIQNGIDGVLMSGVVGTIAAIIGGIAGVTIKSKNKEN